MRKSSPRRIAIIISIITSSLVLGVGILFMFIGSRNFYALLIFIGLVIFFLTYLVVFYSMNYFIIDRIKPIYKTIQNINFAEDKLMRDLEEKDIIEDVQNEVMIWARRKTKEISQLRQLEKYRREFLGNVSHELKTPIFNIQGYILTLLDGGLEDKNINRLYLEKAEKSVNRMITIVNDLESISRLESGELKLEYSRFNIVKMIREAFEEQEIKSKERNITLKFAKSVDKAIYVKADRKRIREVVNNLIDNSIKYGKSGGYTEVDFHDMEDNIMIEIADNGIGISERDLPRIFERFFRADKSRSREMGGTGLGLSIVKHIIEAHNQTLNVQSKQDHGSSFTFTLMKA